MPTPVIPWKMMVVRRRKRFRHRMLAHCPILVRRAMNAVVFVVYEPEASRFA
jgi:hypothetical protein